jgi:hypothetical protein
MSQTKVEAPFVEGVGGGFKNVIINGDMQIFQRATSATTIPSSGYSTVDRFGFSEGSGGAATSELDDLSVADQATTGQARALELNCTSADTSIAAGDRSYIFYNIEAQDCRRFLYGTSAAKTLTLSFWVKSNLTGNFPLTVKKDDNTVYYLPLSYSVSSANTWEKKTITWTPTEGSTSLITASGGAINNDSGRGFQLFFGLMWGSNYTGSQSGTPTWTSSAYFADSDITFVNFYSSTSNNLYLTGLQLEVGDAASDFEHLPFDVQLRRCQRYFYRTPDGGASGVSAAYQHLGNGYMHASTNFIGHIVFPEVMRAAPTCTFAGEVQILDSSGARDPGSNISFESPTSRSVQPQATISGATQGHGAVIRLHNDSDAYVQADAEIG